MLSLLGGQMSIDLLDFGVSLFVLGDLLGDFDVGEKSGVLPKVLGRGFELHLVLALKTQLVLPLLIAGESLSTVEVHVELGLELRQWLRSGFRAG